MEDDWTVEREELVYEYWDCPFCKAEGIRGDLESCTSCGHPRDKDITFYRKEDPAAEEKVTEKEQAERFEAGPDWVCSFCNALNSALEPQCRGCGSSREASEHNYFEMLEKRKAEEARERQAGDFSSIDFEPKKKRGCLMKMAMTAGLLAAAFVLLMIFWPASKEVSYKVAEVYWQRSIAVERAQWVERTDWEPEIKGEDVVRLSSSREIRRYDKRKVGERPETYQDTESYQSGTKQECKTEYQSTGSGASKKITKCRDVPTYATRPVTKTRMVPIMEDFPVYENKVHYKARTFVHLRTDRLAGEDNAPRWPEPELGTGEEGVPDREGTRTAVNRVVLTKVSPEDDGQDRQEITTTEARLKTLYILGGTVVMQVGGLSGKLLLMDGDDEYEPE